MKIPRASTILGLVLIVLAVVCAAGFVVASRIELPVAALLRETSASGAIVCLGAAVIVLILRLLSGHIASGPQQ